MQKGSPAAGSPWARQQQQRSSDSAPWRNAHPFAYGIPNSVGCATRARSCLKGGRQGLGLQSCCGSCALVLTHARSNEADVWGTTSPR